MAGLVLAWGGALAGRLRPDARHTYGCKRASIQAAFINALLSAAVVLAGALVLWQGWNWIDPVLSLLIALIIVVGTWHLFRQSLHLLFDGVPDKLDLSEVHALLEALPGVARVHDLHVWAMSSTETALSAHLEARFHIGHVTLQAVREPFMPPCLDAEPGHVH